MKPNLLKNTGATMVALFIAMLALTTSAHAQGTARIILEAHNVWGDGSGYQLLLDADHNLYGERIPCGGPLWKDANPPADLYNGFEYKIPANADPSTTPKYMVVDGEDYVDIPAGIYDFCITAPQANSKIWIAGDGDAPTRDNDYKFEAGKTYRFTMYRSTEDENDAAKLTITGSGEVTTYKLWIGGTQVTSDNCNDLPHTDGNVSYDPATRVLTLDNATINATGDNDGIWSKTDGLTIIIVGNSTINATGGAAIKVEESHCTMGSGDKLNLSGKKYALNVTAKANLFLSNCTIDCDGSFGNDNNDAMVSINNSNITAKGKGTESVRGIEKLTLEGCAVTKPAGATYDPTLCGVALNGKLVADQVSISTIAAYDLEVAGTKVTAMNCNDLSKIEGLKGSANYDPTTKVLTLNNATIDTESENAILSNIDNLTVKCIGTNMLKAQKAAISLKSSMTINGGGTLNVESEKDCAIYVNNANLIVEDCTLNAKSKLYGISGNNGESENLTIRNANVTAEGTERGSIVDFASLFMEGCSITQPIGAKFDKTKHCVVLNGEKVKTKVVIAKNANAIDTPSADEATATTIYNLSGMRLSAELKQLPKGVYIVNGKKVVKP